MKTSRLCAIGLGLAGLMATAQARVITVTTADNINPGSGTSLLQALSNLQDGDEIRFNIPGPGPHYIATPPGGYPLITKNNVTIDGYSQPGSSPNTNPILAPNNAQIKIVLDSRNGNVRLMDFPGDSPEDDTGYGDTESAVIGVLGAKNFKLQGVSILAVPTISGGQVAVYGVSFAKGASGQVCGCWIGVAPDGNTLAAPADGITGFRYRVRSGGTVLQNILIDDLVIGVGKASANAPAEFNVFTGIPAIPIIVEGNGTRISGNFINVFPDGLRDFNPAFTSEFYGTYEGAIEIGRGGNNTVIGTDGDGINDANERNIIAGTVPQSMGGYDHTIEFYGQNPGTNVVIAGNYIGVAINGWTYFTNGVPAINAAGTSAQYRIGSNFDGVSDDVEGNFIVNNWPIELFPPTDMWWYAQNLNFFDELATSGIVSLRGNSLVNNFPFPVSVMKDNGEFLKNYYAKALADVNAGYVPVLDTNLTTIDRIVGTVPLPNADWSTIIIDIYAADPVGITNGQATAIPDLPWGFVQGRYYMASFVDNGPEDRDKAVGKFDFDISKIEVKGMYLTVTANYVKTGTSGPSAVILTSPFSDPAVVTFTPGSVESVGLRHIVKDTILNKEYLLGNNMPALGNWEPYSSVLGTSTFLIIGNTYADDGASQRWVVALQPADGSKPMVLGEAFYSDDGQPYRGQINASRQNGNPGRVAGDKRPGAVNFMTGAEVSPHAFPDFFNSDGRWNGGMDRGPDGRYAAVQIFSLNPDTLEQTPLTKLFDANLGRLPDGSYPGSTPEISRFGGELACLDNGNFVVVIDDKSNLIAPFRAPTAVIVAPDGTIVKETFQIGTESDQIWSNVAAYQGGFVARFRGVLYFYDNDGNLKGTVDQDTSSGESFDRGRGDGTRIAAHINSPYVFLAGKIRTGDAVMLVAWDARDQSFVAKAEVSEPAFPGNVDRVNLAVDALNRVTVVWECKVPGYESGQYHTAARVFALDPVAKQINPLTKSFLPFYNSAHEAAKRADSLIRVYRPTVSMTTKQIMVAAKGEINSELKPENNIDTPKEVNFYVVITHPAPAEDPTPGIGGPPPTLSVKRNGTTITISWPAATGWVLQATDSLSAPDWKDVGTANPAVITIGPGSKFYRLKRQ